MFVRKKKNRSGTTSVVIAQKKQGKFFELKTVGISKDEEEIGKFIAEGKNWITPKTKGEGIFTHATKSAEEKQIVEYLIPGQNPNSAATCFIRQILCTEILPLATIMQGIMIR